MQCSPFKTLCLGSIGMDIVIMLCLGSIGMDGVISELCYKGTILQRNYGKMTIPQGLHRRKKVLEYTGLS